MSHKTTAPLKLAPLAAMRRATEILLTEHARVRVKIGERVTYVGSADELPAEVPLDQTIEVSASRHITLLATGVITEREFDDLDNGPVEIDVVEGPPPDYVRAVSEDVIGAPD